VRYKVETLSMVADVRYGQIRTKCNETVCWPRSGEGCHVGKWNEFYVKRIDMIYYHTKCQREVKLEHLHSLQKSSTLSELHVYV
jgi:hypothetical protein